MLRKRLCLACNEEMNTLHQNKLTCSDKCRFKLQRAIQKLRKTINQSD